MSTAGFVAGALRLVRRRPPSGADEAPRILVIRRNRMGDMICTLPLVRALRRRYPQAQLTVACDEPGVPIARACSAIDEVLPLGRGSRLWTAALAAPRRWQEFDLVMAAKAGFDRRLGWLARLTNAARRIGYENTARSGFYTDPVPIPDQLWSMHQIDATLGLLAPLGIVPPTSVEEDLRLDLPPETQAFAQRLSAFWQGHKLVLVNLSSTRRPRFRDDDMARLLDELAARGDCRVGLVSLPTDRPRAERLAEERGPHVRALATSGPLELAALLTQARVFVTGEGGAAHLAAAAGTPSVVLWSDAPFEKWHSRGPRHCFLRAEDGEDWLRLERVRAAVGAYL